MKIKLLFLLITSFCFSQEDAWVYFTNKPNASYYLANPLEMLSQRALDRRNTQGIALNETDAPVHQPYIDAITNTNGIAVMAKSKWLNALHIRGSVTDIQSLESLSFVDYVQFANHSLNSKSPQENESFQMRNNNKLDVEVNFNYGNSANQIEMLNGHLLHQQDYTGQGKIIAVLDSGFIGVDTAAPFQRLQTNGLILGGYNFPDRNTNYYSRHNHGTMVLSCMGGFADNQLVGTAPDAQYYLFITEDVNSENPVEESYWVEAAELADSLGVDVINTSLGYFGYDNPNYSYNYSQMNGVTAFISRGADMAFSKGIICVTSAGNSGSTSDPHIGVPADAIYTLAIGAVNSTENYASFSSIGPSSDNRIKPDLAAKGQSATVSLTTGSIANASGTSFASPILAGMVATLWSAVPNLTNEQIVQVIKESADQYTSPDEFKGYGIPDFSSALAAALSLSSFQQDVVNVYPNPFQDVLTVKWNNDKKATIEIYNILGGRILNKTITKYDNNLTLDGLSSGIYIYKISSEISNLEGKLIKN